MKAFVAWLKALLGIKDPVPAPEKSPEIANPLPVSNPISTSPVPLAALSWELPCNDGQVNQGARPDRKEWSQALYLEIDKNYSIFRSAADLKDLIPNADSLTRPQIVTLLCELMSTVAEYECSWNAASADKDVNGSSEAKNLARGLFQMNQGDQSSYHTGTSYTYQELNDPIKNIKVAIAIMVYLLKVRGKITYKVGEKNPIIGYFFATLLTDGKVGPTVLTSAKKRMAAMKFETTVDQTPKVPEAPKPVLSLLSSAPWVEPLFPYLNMDETNPVLNAAFVPEWALEGLASFKTLAGNDHAWCSVTANWAMRKAGIKGTNDAMAASWRTWGVSCDYVFGAVLGIRHASGGGHVGFFLYWIDEAKKIAAVLSGNSDNKLWVQAYNISGNKAGHDEVIGGPRFPAGLAPGIAVSMKDVLAKYPNLIPGGQVGSTR